MSERRSTTDAPAPELTPQERRLRNRTLLLAVVCPIVIAVWFADLGDTALTLIEVVVWLALPTYVLARPLYQWLFGGDSFLACVLKDLRFGLPHAPLSTNDARLKRPRTTLWLIAANVAVFLTGASDALALSHCEPSSWIFMNWPSMFAHADWDHLLGNMIFLWTFGAPLEKRIGSRELLIDYLVMGTVANAIQGVGAAFAGECSGSLGASGAISGVMGVYLVRCHFRSVLIGIPTFTPGTGGLIQYGVHVNAVALLTFFFLKDLLGAREQLAGTESLIGHWAHLGGYFCGLAIGYGRRYYREGLREELAERIHTDPWEADLGRGRSARETLLEHDPDHPEALLSRAREACRYQLREEAARDYVRVVELLLRSDRARAAEVFLEYYRKYLRPLALDRQLALTSALAARGELDVAARCLELAAKEPGADPTLRARAQAYESRLLSALGLPEASLLVPESSGD